MKYSEVMACGTLGINFIGGQNWSNIAFSLVNEDRELKNIICPFFQIGGTLVIPPLTYFNIGLIFGHPREGSKWGSKLVKYCPFLHK